MSSPSGVRGGLKRIFSISQGHRALERVKHSTKVTATELTNSYDKFFARPLIKPLLAADGVLERRLWVRHNDTSDTEPSEIMIHG